MQIKRVEFGVWKPLGLEFDYIKGACGCHILTVGPFYVTWLADECYYYEEEEEDGNQDSND